MYIYKKEGYLLGPRFVKQARTWLSYTSPATHSSLTEVMWQNLDTPIVWLVGARMRTPGLPGHPVPCIVQVWPTSPHGLPERRSRPAIHICLQNGAVNKYIYYLYKHAHYNQAAIDATFIQGDISGSKIIFFLCNCCCWCSFFTVVKTLETDKFTDTWGRMLAVVSV